MNRKLFVLFICLALLLSACSNNPQPIQTAIPPTEEPLNPALTPSTVAIIPAQPTPGNVIGGGTVRDGPFAFDLCLFRDPTLNQQPVAASLFSDLNGVGAYLYWSYQGTGEIGPVETYWGTLPSLNMLPQGSSPSISPGPSGGRAGGVLLPGGFSLPGVSKAGDRIAVELKVVTPQRNYGAVLRFTLKQGVNGFELEDISVETLPAGG